MKTLITSKKTRPFTAYRKKAILQCLYEGMPNEAIAKRLHMSVGTVQGYIGRLNAEFLAKDSIALMTRTHPGGNYLLAKHPCLTPRENAIIHMRMRGMPLIKICLIKGISLATGQEHLKNIRRKTNSRNLRNVVAIILDKTMEEQNET